MTIKIRIPKAHGEPSGEGHVGLPRDPLMRAALLVFLIVAVSVTAFFSYYYIKYDRIIEKRFRTPVFANSAKIYALPRVIATGRRSKARKLRQTAPGRLLEQDGESKLGLSAWSTAELRSHRERSRITARSRRGSRSDKGQVTRITSRGTDLSAYELEPQLVTALFDAEQRSKRQVVKYNDIPR